MRKLSVAALVFIFSAVSIGLVIAAEKSKVYYVCNCKDDCKCNSVSTEPGKCKCGSEMKAMHLLAIENGTGIFCRCGADCTCERSKDDPNKCGCGKPVKKVDLKGKYVCACGADCKCNTISDKPGKCSCGKDLKQL